jgi:cellulose synthase/poly-beta-1,6-N-acetylglucosamine synthase-like glycosyltransferase
MTSIPKRPGWPATSRHPHDHPTELAAGAAALLILLPVLVLFVQVLLGCLPARPLPMATGKRARVAVLVPAHDEASVIRATLASITPQLAAGDRLLVVADNCSDDTATLARQAGAQVVERQMTDCGARATHWISVCATWRTTHRRC